jgi:hypothetical protein
VNDTLKAFQSKFEFQLKQMNDNFQKKMDDEKEFVRNSFTHTNDYL